MDRPEDRQYIVDIAVENETDMDGNEDGNQSEEELMAGQKNTKENVGLLEEHVIVKSKKRAKELYCTKSRKTICCIIIGVVLLMIMISLCVELAITLALTLKSSNSGSHEAVNKLTMEDIFDPNFQTRSFHGTWVNGNSLLYQSTTNGVLLYSPIDNTTRVLVEPDILSSLQISSVKLSPTGDYLLLIGSTNKVFRHSFTGKYYIHKIEDSTTWLLSDDVQFGEWNTLADILVYVKGYNIYLYNVQSNSSEQHTTSGEENKIYNGIPDWVYEEEVFATNFALWWSPGGQYILYCTFNDTMVEPFKFPEYGSPYHQYTHIDSIAYPKAGTSNPTVTVWLMNINDVGGAPNQLLVPGVIGEAGDHYVLSGGWVNSSIPVVSWSNRAQNKIIHCLYDTITSSSPCTMVYEQTSNAWIEVVEPPSFTPQHMILIDAITVNDQDGDFLHLVQIDLETDSVISLTTGLWEVTDLIGTTDNELLYVSTQTNPWQRHIYNSNGQCLTCDTAQWLDVCHYWSGSCSSTLNYCLLQCSGPGIPFSVIVRYVSNVFTTVIYMERNDALKEAIEPKDLPTFEVIEIPTTSPDEPSLYARVLYPPDSDKTCQESHPVLFYVYGGPYSQMIGDYTVTSRLFPAYLSSEFDMMVVSVDGRGTGFRGNNYKYPVYKQLGILETIDQIRAARYFHDQCYVDGSHFAIYGSSYGGYMAGMVGFSQSTLFTDAISQSPVTDWSYYDSIYTERYMGTPTDNSEGYKITSLLNRVDNSSVIPRYLLIHGTGDDNVHFQNTAQLVSLLTEHEVQYELMFYTDQDHSLSGGKTRNHLYQLIHDFLMKNGFKNNN